MGEGKLGVFTASIFIAMNSVAKPSFANECPTVRLDQGNGSAVHLKVRNQNDVGTCYAVVGAELVDAWRFSHFAAGLSQSQIEAQYNQITSPLPAAVDNATNKVKETLHMMCPSELLGMPYMPTKQPGVKREWLPFEGGNACDASNLILKNGSCSDDVLIGALTQKNPNTDKSDMAELILALEPFGHLWYECMELKGLYNRVPQEKQRRQVQCNLPYMDFPDTPTELLDKLVADQESKVEHDTTLKSLKTDIDTICNGHRISVPNFKCVPRVTGIHGNEPDKNLIDSVLSNEGQPVGISFSNCLFYSDKPLLTAPSPSETLLGSERCGSHQVIIIGSGPDPKNPQKCAYLLQNSWGAECSMYASRLACEPGSGKVWVDKDELLSQTSTIQYLEAK